MAVAFGGGDQMTSRQFRAESGISCVAGVDTVSGGLRIFDVQRVAQAHGVAINYGGMQSWPASALAYRLGIGQGAIVLGDCQEAPISPSLNVVYHSAFVHGLRVSDGVQQTHWHDPRLGIAYWVSVAKVITYWEGMDHGYRYAGFVAPNQIEQPPDTSTGGTFPEDTVNRLVHSLTSTGFGRQLTVAVEGAGRIRFSGPGYPAATKGKTYTQLGSGLLENSGDGVQGEVYLVADYELDPKGELIAIKAAEMTAGPDLADPPNTVPLVPGLYRVS